MKIKTIHDYVQEINNTDNSADATMIAMEYVSECIDDEGYYPRPIKQRDAQWALDALQRNGANIDALCIATTYYRM